MSDYAQQLVNAKALAYDQRKREAEALRAEVATLRALLLEVRDWAVRMREWLVKGGLIIGAPSDVSDFDAAIARIDEVLR